MVQSQRAGQHTEQTTGFYTLDEKGGAQYSDPAEALKVSDSDGKPFWLHLQSDDTNTPDIMARHGVPDRVVDALCIDDTRPKAHVLEGGILVYLRGINKNADADPDDMVSVRLWITDTCIVSTRRTGRGLLSVRSIKEALLSGQGPANSAEFLCLLIGNVTDIIAETVDALELRLDQLEQDIDTDASARQHVSAIRKQCASLRRYLSPQRDALESLMRIQSVIKEHHVLDIREQFDRMMRYLEDLEIVRERATLLHEEIRNRIAEMQGQRLYVLSLVTLIFLPLSFLTGVFGMNVAGLPGTENPEAFVLLSGVMFVIAALITAVMVWRRWF